MQLKPRAIFENLRMLTKLYRQVKEANERLTLHDKNAASINNSNISTSPTQNNTITPLLHHLRVIQIQTKPQVVYVAPLRIIPHPLQARLQINKQ
jgi:hypothetical protein